MSATDFLANGAFAAAMNTLGRLHHARLMAQARDPRAAQAAALRRILNANSRTEQVGRSTSGPSTTSTRFVELYLSSRIRS